MRVIHCSEHINYNDKNTYNDRIKSFGKFRFLREVECHNIKKWPLEKLMGFLVNISNAGFAMGIDNIIKNDIAKFLELGKESCSGETEIVLPYKIVIAVK